MNVLHISLFLSSLFRFQEKNRIREPWGFAFLFLVTVSLAVTSDSDITRINTSIIESCMLLDECEKSDEIGTLSPQNKNINAPYVEMLFDSIEEAKKYYEEYGRRKAVEGVDLHGL
ncbi:hypothetical protein HHK36_007739 [Tetracentron sinense]|uniref:Uncharacterized protein n=1 Tax=Tetracentron sinense TaxID=13715 RepID=A0A835DIN8_TETSI|nr:hypothetical protein HHK36_007739 [Tetracentron sinense]